MAQIRHPKDMAAGGMFVAFGIAALALAADYPMGTAGRMGPGYFPRILGLLLIGFGVLLVARSFRLQGAPLVLGRLRPVAIVLGSVVAFGLVVNHLGLVLSSILLILATSAASNEFRWQEALISGIVLAAASVAAFTWGLGLQFTIWPSFLAGS